MCIEYLDYTNDYFFLPKALDSPAARLCPYQSPSSFLILSLTSLRPPRLNLPGLAGPAKSPPNLDLALGLGLVGALGPPVPTNAGTVTFSPEGMYDPGLGEGG